MFFENHVASLTVHSCSSSTKGLFTNPPIPWGSCFFLISNILAICFTLIYIGNPNILGNPQGHPPQKKITPQANVSESSESESESEGLGLGAVLVTSGPMGFFPPKWWVKDQGSVVRYNCWQTKCLGVGIVDREICWIFLPPFGFSNWEL